MERRVTIMIRENLSESKDRMPVCTMLDEIITHVTQCKMTGVPLTPKPKNSMNNDIAASLDPNAQLSLAAKNSECHNQLNLEAMQTATTNR